MSRYAGLLSCLILGLLLLAPLAAQGQGNIERDLLVSTDWLDAHLGRPGVIVVHVEETTDSTDHYAIEHIPGAHFVATEELGIVRSGIPGMLPPLYILIELVRNLGIDDKTKKIVLYGPTNPGGPARLYHVLDYLGLGDRAALLDGHFPRWKAEDRPTTNTDPPEAKYSDFIPIVNPQILTTRSVVGDLMSTLAVDPSLDGRGFVLFDSRTDAGYATGHIPGAVQGNPLSVFEGFSENGDGGVNPLTRWLLLSRHQIVTRYNSLGLDDDELAITSCRTGIAGSLLYFVLKYAGFNVTLYDGSFNEWSGVKIEDEHELGIWRHIYPGYAGSEDGMLPIVTSLDRWDPVIEVP